MRRNPRTTSLLLAAMAVLAGCGGDGAPAEDLPFVFPDPAGPTDPGVRDPGAEDVGMDAPRPDLAADPGEDDPGAGDAGHDGGGDPGTDPGTDPGSDPGNDPGVTDVGPLCGGQVCGGGTTCINNICEPCIFADACGPECVACAAPTPLCYEGRCVACRVTSDCDEGAWCDAQTCVPCGDADPLHCGNLCEVCGGQTPSCEAGRCVCTPQSCGTLTCLDGACTDCSTPQACGPTCQPCPGELPFCDQGACVECVTDPDCGAARWCDAGTCADCGLDPLHCGTACEACSQWEPECTVDGCACTAGSCGSGRRCVDGDCEGCDTAEACGPTCVACVAPNDICRNGEACVACLSDADCEATQYCTGSWTCADRCYGALGCVSDNAPTGLKCSTAKVIGRRTAVAGTRISGDTTDDGDDDNLPSGIFNPGPDCWDGFMDNFYRVYLMTGDRLTVTATPLSATYQLSLKLYQGTSCEADWETSFITCQWKGGDNKPQTYTHIASTDGWVTVVVDGASAFDEERDEGPYNLDVKLDCVGPLCCCN